MKRGGKRAGAGRPATGIPHKTRHTVTLDKGTLDTLLATDKNLSEAIRILVKKGTDKAIDRSNEAH